jgi:hypothetical protein
MISERTKAASRQPSAAALSSAVTVAPALRRRLAELAARPSQRAPTHGRPRLAPIIVRQLPRRP